MRVRHTQALWQRSRHRRIFRMLRGLSGDALWVQVLILTWDGVS
jgi:hypothetical protein